MRVIFAIHFIYMSRASTADSRSRFCGCRNYGLMMLGRLRGGRKSARVPDYRSFARVTLFAAAKPLRFWYSARLKLERRRLSRCGDPFGDPRLIPTSFNNSGLHRGSTCGARRTMRVSINELGSAMVKRKREIGRTARGERKGEEMKPPVTSLV